MSVQENLQQLFQLDKQVRGLQGRLDQAKRRERVLREKLEQLSRQRDELRQQLQQVQSRVHRLEQDGQEIDQRIEALRERMNNATSNKQYSAFLKEVDELKKSKSTTEEQAIEQMSRVEELNGELEQAEQSVQQQQKLVDAAHRELEEAQSEVGEQLEELTRQRDEAAKAIPAQILSQFQRAAEMNDGEAMAAVVEENRRRMEYTCGGCYMALPIERVSALTSEQEEATTCPNCSRLLYLDRDLKSAISAG